MISLFCGVFVDVVVVDLKFPVDASITKNIEKAYLLNKEMVLLGDFNVDFLNANQASKHKLIETLTNLHLTQLVKEVTRPVNFRNVSRSYLVKSSGKIDMCTNKEYWNFRSPSNNGGSTRQRSDFTEEKFE